MTAPDSPLGKARQLVAKWAADSRYYFDAPLHPTAADDLASRIANALETALKQASPAQPEKPKRTREKAAP